MIRASVRWLASSAVLLFAVTVLTFLLAALAPGDAAKTILSGQTGYTPAQYHQLRHELGIDQPLPLQYWHWLSRLLHGSLGTDLFSGQPIAQALNGRIEASLSIIVGAVLLSAVAGVGLGVYSAVYGTVAADRAEGERGGR